MSVFECTYNGCTEGEGGARWKTPAFPTQVAKEYLELHIEDAHGRHVVGARGVAKARLVKGPSNKFQSFDDHSFHVNTDRDIAKQYAPYSSRRRRRKLSHCLMQPPVKLGEMVEMFVLVDVSKIYHTQCSEEDAVRRSSKPSRYNGTYMQSTTMGWMLGSSDNSC